MRALDGWSCAGPQNAVAGLDRLRAVGVDIKDTRVGRNPEAPVSFEKRESRPIEDVPKASGRIPEVILRRTVPREGPGNADYYQAAGAHGTVEMGRNFPWPIDVLQHGKQDRRPDGVVVFL